MELRQLGRTGVAVSTLGLGTVKFGRNEGLRYAPFDIPDLSHLSRLVGQARELGINFVDTAAAYGESETRLGFLLKERRQEWVICTKAGELFKSGRSSYDFTPTSLERSLTSSLRKLQTDYVDIFLIHCNSADAAILQNDAVIEMVQRFKTRGLARLVGASTNTIEGGLLTANLFDTVMVSYNSIYTEQSVVINRAKETGCGVLIKKPLACGVIEEAGGALAFCAGRPGVSSVIVGTINPEHLATDAAAVGKSDVEPALPPNTP